MSKEQTLPANVREQIEREYPLKRFMSSYEKAERRISINAALRGAEITLENMFAKLSRIEVIDEHGRQYVKYFNNGCTVDFQDDNRTMKVFLTPPNK